MGDTYSPVIIWFLHWACSEKLYTASSQLEIMAMVARTYLLLSLLCAACPTVHLHFNTAWETHRQLPWYWFKKNKKIKTKQNWSTPVQHCCILSLKGYYLFSSTPWYALKGHFATNLLFYQKHFWTRLNILLRPGPTLFHWCSNWSCCSMAMCCCWYYRQSLELYPLQMAPAFPGPYWIVHV